MYVGIIGTVYIHMHAWYNTHTALLTAAMTGTYVWYYVLILNVVRSKHDEFQHRRRCYSYSWYIRSLNTALRMLLYVAMTVYSTKEKVQTESIFMAELPLNGEL